MTVEEIQKVAAENSLILVKLNESYYEIQGCTDFAELFAFDRWEHTQKRSYDDPLVVFSFAEEWIVEIYADGKVSAYYGYSSGKQKSTAYYTVPAELITALSDFVEVNGELQDKRFPESAFYH